MPPANVWSRVLVGLCVAGVALAWLGSQALTRGGSGYDRLIDTAALAAGGASFLMVCVALARHFRARREEEEAGETRRSGRRDGADAAAAAALAALPAALRCLDQPALVVAEAGRILQANPAATIFFDPLGRPGGRIGELIEPADWRQAVVKARGAGAPVAALLRRVDGAGDLAARIADLGFQAGAVAVFDVATGAPPPPPTRPGGRWGTAPDPEAALAAQPMAALIVAVELGKLIEVATVKLTGGRAFPTLSLDFKVAQPELGRVGRRFVEVWPELARALTGVVVVAADPALTWGAVAGELAAAGFPPVEPPPMIDLSRLVAAYDPALAGLGVEALAAALDIAEPDPARRLARIAALLAARLAAKMETNGGGKLGDFLCRSGDVGDDALKPPEIAAQAGETTQTS